MSAAEEAGRDGAAVQADLRAVIERAKKEDARAVLGVPATAGAVQARAAFHALCKRYHPARFARSSAETVRLANEAFLAIKRAYDGLIKPEPAKPAEPTRPIEIPPTRPASLIAAGTVPIATRLTEKLPVQPRPAGAPLTSTTKPTEKLPAQAAPSMRPAPRPATGAIGPPSAAKLTEKLPAQKRSESIPDGATEEQRFSIAMELLRRRLWRDAEKLLGELAVSVPAERKYRAYRHYARGRIIQDEGRLDEARAEWERALRLEPDLTVARTAIDQLPEPPKPTGGGLLSKLFKR